MDADDDRSGIQSGAQRRIGRLAPEPAIGGLSLDDFRQDLALAEIEIKGHRRLASDHSCEVDTSERAARKKFRQHEDREKHRA